MPARAQLVRERLEDVGPDRRMVESLAPMWEEERARCGGTGPPPAPPDPPRAPQPLCPTVEIERAKFQAGAHMLLLAAVCLLLLLLACYSLPARCLLAAAHAAAILALLAVL